MWDDIYQSYHDAGFSEVDSQADFLDSATNIPSENPKDDQQSVVINLQLAQIEKSDLMLLVPLQKKFDKLKKQYEQSKARINELEKRLNELEQNDLV